MDEYISIPQLAKILGLSRIAVYKKVTSGQIKGVKIGRNFAIPKSSLPELFSSMRLTEETKQEIEKSVKHTVSQYADTLKLLGND